MSPFTDMSSNDVASQTEPKTIRTFPIFGVVEQFCVFYRWCLPDHPILSSRQFTQVLNFGTQLGSIVLTLNDENGDQVVQYALVLLVTGITQKVSGATTDIQGLHKHAEEVLGCLRTTHGPEHVAAHIWAAWLSQMLCLNSSAGTHLMKALLLQQSLPDVDLPDVDLGQCQVLSWSCHLLLSQIFPGEHVPRSLYDPLDTRRLLEFWKGFNFPRFGPYLLQLQALGLVGNVEFIQCAVVGSGPAS